MTDNKFTFCRICEALCPLVVVNDPSGGIRTITSDKDHPVSQGFACHKGMSLAQLHNDPDRANYPLRRVNAKLEMPGEFERLEWDTALEEIGERILDVQRRFGKNSVAVYMGNPVGFNSRAYIAAAGFSSLLDTEYSFSANSQDVINKFAASEHIYGSHDMLLPDLKNTDFFIGFGCNPKISKGTIYSTHNIMKQLRDIKKRGGKVLFVNPRKIESSNESTGEVMQVKSDSDVYLLAALLEGIFRREAVDLTALSVPTKNIDGLRKFVAEYPAERVERVVGIESDQIHRLVEDVLAASSVALYMGTGVNQTRQGTLAFWLLNMITVVTGNFGSLGGSFKPAGLTSGKTVKRPKDVQTPYGRVRPVCGDLPGNMLADFIESEDRTIRALINIGGNPLLSMAGGQRLNDAFTKLDLLVSIDIYRSATGEISDYILPALDMLEREDVTLAQLGFQLEPYLQYTDAIVEPKFERRNDWWILAGIARAMGKPSQLDNVDPDGWGVADHVLKKYGTSRDNLRKYPHQTKVLTTEKNRLLSTLDNVVTHSDGKIDCCPEAFRESFETCRIIFEQLQNEAEDTLKMISMRTLYMHNSWLANLPRMRKGPHAINELHMHTVDAKSRGLAEGERINVFNVHGSITTTLRLDDTLRRGTVCMTHGYGHDFAPALRVASSFPGANVNRLLPTGIGSFEGISGMSWMNGIAVEVKAI